MRFARGLCVLAALVGCNGILGIEEPILRSEDGGVASSASAGPDGSVTGSDGSVAIAADASTTDAPAGDAGPITCTVSGPLAASKGPVVNGPALAYLAGPPDIWGLAWYEAGTIKYNAVDTAGTFQNTSDLTIASSAGVDYGSHPRLTRAGTSFVLAAGALTQPDSAYPAIKLIDPRTGGNPAFVPGPSATSSIPPLVGGLAVDDSGTKIAVSSRGYSAAAATDARVSLFSAAPATYSTSSTPAPAYATAVAWTASANGARFAVAKITSPTSSGGVIDMYDATLASLGSLVFTRDGDVPAVGFVDVAIAGAAGKLAVAWVDARDSTEDTDVYLTSIDVVSGTRVAAGEVQVGEPNKKKRYPRVVYDGRSLAVAWIEQAVPGSYQVMLRRYSPELVALDKAPRCMSCGLGVYAQNTVFGLATGKVNEYGVAVMLLTNPEKQYFNHMDCTGP